MNNFGAKLAELLERKRLSQAELSRVSGINDALVSRWVNGQQRFVSPDDLEKVCIHISPLPKDRAELVRAHLLDEMPLIASELIDIRVRGQSVAPSQNPPAYRSTLPLNLQRALDILGQEAVTDADVRSVILGLAEMLAKTKQVEFSLSDQPTSSGAAHPLSTAVVTESMAKYHLAKKSRARPRAARKPSHTP